MSQKRFFLLLQKLENLEQEISIIRNAAKQISDISASIEQTTAATDARLMFAGMALLLSHPAINAEDRAKYNCGWDVDVRLKA